MSRSTPPREIIAKPEGVSYNSIIDEESLMFSRSDDELRILPAEQMYLSKWDYIDPNYHA
jgi:hypothetical protein